MSAAPNLRRGSVMEMPTEPSLEPSFEQKDCVAFVSDDSTQSVVNAACRARFPGLQVQRGGAKEAIDFLSSGAPPRLLIVDVSDSNKPLTAMLPIVAAFAEDTRVIAIGDVNDINLYREMIDAGISDYLVKPVSEKSLSSALTQSEMRKSAGQTEAKGDAKDKPALIAVLGTRGGVGASTVAMNLAWLMSRDHKRDTMLLDLDLQCGTIALALDVEPSHGLREVLDNPARIDSLFVTSVAVKCGDRLSVLAAEEAVDDEVGYNPTAVSMLLDELRRQSACVVVDVPRNAASARAVVLSVATDVVVVTDLTLAGLRDSIRLTTMIQQVSPAGRIIFMANRDGGKESTVSKAEFEKALGRTIQYVIPEDAKAHQAAANAGKPVVAAAANSKIATVLKSAASAMNASSDQSKKEQNQKKSFWSFSKKK